MKNRFKTMSGALALTFMLLFGAVAFAGTASASVAIPNNSAEGLSSARNDRLWDNHHRHHEYRRHMRRERRREWRREWRREHR
jgi:hypothetical protein